MDACDLLGMLVMDELFDVWDTGNNPQDYSVHFAEWGRRDLTDTVLRDRNHPSVVMWSLGNEITDNTGGRRGTEMAELLRSLDRTRPITLGGGSTHSADDPSWQYVNDVHYNANGKGYAQMHAAHPDKAMTHNETFPATIYQDLKFAGDSAWAMGTWIWAAWDYPRRGRDRQATDTSRGDRGFRRPERHARLVDLPGVSPHLGRFRVPYPYSQGSSGDFDLIGQRKPQNYWRVAVSGRSPVEMLVERPTPPGTEQVAVW
jgi:beta-galactosidase